ncbi:MAG: multicopper oxidase domain-containing protein [Nitrospirae bacterium]|nr:multicopper oxidase domain-containing protein [Nitrospirota bacterium]
MTFTDSDFAPAASWPAATIRVPRGVIFHGATQAQGPPPHTIHWHGIEPTPMNDGVGHCSMELGTYTYQWQPNFIGTYFYHCHRNTVQHFEFGLYGMLLIEPPDAFDPTIPIIAGGPPKNPAGYPRRTAANTSAFPQFPGFVPGDATFGVGNAADTGVGNPHAFTIPYDVEALWVLDDRDSVWSDLASNAKAFYPGGANTADGPNGLVIPVQPSIDDQFPDGFFHDFNADYWFVTGVPVPAAKGGEASIGATGLIPNTHNSGVTGMQIAINADLNQTILVRCLDAAYNSVRITFPIDAVIIAFDGRALGVPPFAKYNHAFLLPANTPIQLSTARRFDALLRRSTPFDGAATVEFIDTRGEKVTGAERRLMTAKIPIKIGIAV